MPSGRQSAGLCIRHARDISGQQIAPLTFLRHQAGALTYFRHVVKERQAAKETMRWDRCLGYCGYFSEDLNRRLSRDLPIAARDRLHRQVRKQSD